jgi:hypothetical protein
VDLSLAPLAPEFSQSPDLRAERSESRYLDINSKLAGKISPLGMKSSLPELFISIKNGGVSVSLLQCGHPFPANYSFRLPERYSRGTLRTRE